jgi:hypothetical protein
MTTLFGQILTEISTAKCNVLGGGVHLVSR